MRECAAREEAGEYLAEPKQARGVAAQDFILISTTQLESGDDFDRAVVAHVKTVEFRCHFRCQANLIDLFSRRPFLKLSQSVSTTPRNSGLLGNSSASFPKSLLNTIASSCNSFASA